MDQAETKKLMDEFKKQLEDKLRESMDKIMRPQMETYTQRVTEEVLKSMKDALLDMENRVRGAEAYAMNNTITTEFVIDVLQKKGLVGSDDDIKKDLQALAAEYNKRIRAKFAEAKKEKADGGTPGDKQPDNQDPDGVPDSPSS